MIAQNIQKFTTGEVRIFRPDESGVWRLVMHLRAPGDPGADDLTGTAIDDMPARFEPAPEPEA
ncbi:MAG: hypothetical protein RLO08_00290 [Parvibaculaceae bacterium]